LRIKAATLFHKPGFKTRELSLPRLHTISIEENPREYPMLDFLTDRGIAELSFWWAGVAMPIATVVVILYARA
jgi:hypothetical protein